MRSAMSLGAIGFTMVVVGYALAGLLSTGTFIAPGEPRERSGIRPHLQLNIDATDDYPHTRIVERSDGKFEVERQLRPEGSWHGTTYPVLTLEEARGQARYLKAIDDQIKQSRRVTRKVIEEI